MRVKGLIAGNKSQGYRAIILRGDKGVVFRGLTAQLPVRERAVLEKSVEFFGDPEPCMIHRSAVLASIFEEFENWLDTVGAGREFEAAITDIPEHLASCLEIGGFHDKS